MTSDEPPRENEPKHSVEQGETGQQTKPNLGSETAEKVENTLSKRNICPYLGLRDDRTVVSMQPTPAHVCFASRQRYFPSLEHQRERCLSTNYPGCKLYPDKKPDKDANNNLYGLQGEVSKDKGGRRRWLVWIAAAPLIIVAGTFIYAFASGLLRLPNQLTYNPVPAATVAVVGADEAPSIVPDVTETPTGIPSKTPTANPTVSPTGTSAPTLTLTPPEATPAVVAQGAQATARNTPTPVEVTPAVTDTPTKSATSTATKRATATATERATETSVPTLTPTPPDSTPAAVAQSAQPTASNTPRPNTPTPIPDTPTPETVVETVTISPDRADVGWWASAQTQTGQIGDSYLYAGINEAQAYISAVRFDLGRVPSDSTIQSAVVRLTGLSDDQLDRSGNSSWIVQIISEGVLLELEGETFFTLYEAPSAFDLVPNVETANVGSGVVNEWIFDSAMRDWLHQQLLDGAASVVMRIIPLENPGNALFAWDSGHGAESSGAAPELVLELSPIPLTPTSP